MERKFEIAARTLCWASEASPTLGCSIEISRDIYMYVGLSTFVYGNPIHKICMLKCMGGITWSKHAHAQSQFWELETKCRL